MRPTTEIFGNVLVVHPPDELTDDFAANFVDAVDEMLEDGHRQLVIAMDRTEGFDSAGLTSLLDLRDRVQEQGGKVRVSSLGDVGTRVFKVTRLDKQFDVYPDTTSAVASFQ
jgi:anti-sigma B factor antagonist